MKVVKCEKCKHDIVTAMNINCRILRFDVIHNPNNVETRLMIGVYCPVCGFESIFNFSHIFNNKMLDDLQFPEIFLRDIALCESGII